MKIIAVFLTLTWIWLYGYGYAYEGIEITNGGSLAGEVKFKGSAPPPKKLEVTKDQAVCGAQPKDSEDLIVSTNGGIKNVLISIPTIQKGKKMEPLSENPKLDQRGCAFNPHVQIIPAKATLDVLNNDGILHNVHTYCMENPPVNKAQPKFKKVLPLSFEKPEVIKVACDAHGWMNAWLVVTDNPYSTLTDENGSFKLTDVPAGTYTLELWHESLGKQTKEVTVKANEEAKVSFELSK